MLQRIPVLIFYLYDYTYVYKKKLSSVCFFLILKSGRNLVWVDMAIRPFSLYVKKSLLVGQLLRFKAL